MKQISALLFLIVFSVITLFSDRLMAQTTENEKQPRILIAYYSLSGNTQKIAQAIQQTIGGDLFEIKTAQSYPTEYRVLVTQAKKEINDGYLPTLENAVTQIDPYDIVFIGSPNWWGTITPAVSSFLKQTNLKGKTVIPFITHGGGGIQNTIRDLTKQCTGCLIDQGSFSSYEGDTIGLTDFLEKLKQIN